AVPRRSTRRFLIAPRELRGRARTPGPRPPDAGPLLLCCFQCDIIMTSRGGGHGPGKGAADGAGRTHASGVPRPAGARGDGVRRGGADGTRRPRPRLAPRWHRLHGGARRTLRGEPERGSRAAALRRVPRHREDGGPPLGEPVLLEAFDLAARAQLRELE